MPTTRRSALALGAGIALALALWPGSSFLVRAGSDVVSPNQLFLAGGAQSISVVVAMGGMAGLAGVSLIDGEACTAAVGSFAVIDDSTFTFTEDPSTSCLGAVGFASDALQIQALVGKAVYGVQAVRPLTLVAGPGPGPLSTPTPALTPTPGPGQASSPRPAATPPSAQSSSDPILFTVSAPVMSINHLAYTGPATIDGTPVLQFTMDSAAMTGLSVTGPCVGGETMQSSIPISAVGNATDSVALDATSLSFTGLATPFTPGNPPTLPFPSSLTLPGVAITAVQFVAGTLTTPGLSTGLVSC